MAHIRKLGERRYQARCVDPDGRECSKISSRRTDAEDKIKEVEHSKLDGSYIDHKNPITVAQYAKQWSTTRPHRSTTATRVKSLIDNHIAGTRLGGRRLSAVRTSEVQAWGDGAFANPFSWHRAACSTNAALDLQCRSPRSNSGKEPGDPLEHAEVREAKDHPVVRYRGSRPGQRHAGALPSYGHPPSGPLSADRRAAGAASPRCRLPATNRADRVAAYARREAPGSTKDTKITTDVTVAERGRRGLGSTHRRISAGRRWLAVHDGRRLAVPAGALRCAGLGPGSPEAWPTGW